jgi:UDP-N-acetylglucosamine--N-acetylmuramyl-(pentapeptide) pyrophosphoryl-undecaprenol N-acetylglucosamine transferase
MKIVFTGGGTGGHFYPIIAIAEEVNAIIDEQKILQAKLYYFSDTPYDKTALFDNGITYKKISAGKNRVYFSPLNFLDYFKAGFGIIQAIFSLYSIFPDVVVGKGGYASFPTLVAARLLKIPILIHESDSFPGRVNQWAGKFATRIAISFPEAAQYFPKDRVAFTGHPIRKEIAQSAKDGVFEYFGLDASIPTILVLGGSSGAEIINNAILDSLNLLLPQFQIIHQTGAKNITEVKNTAEIVMGQSEFKGRYKPVPFLNTLGLRMASGAASVIISRAGSMIFEIASWGVPAIIIPITKSNGDHQRKNAFTYARSGAGEVIEENNLTGTILAAELTKIVSDKARLELMRKNAAAFTVPDAGHKIAEEVVRIALTHEK